MDYTQQTIWRYNENPNVVLTPSEMGSVCKVATDRQIENLLLGRKNAHGFCQDVGWNAHIEGAGGEMAFAKWANRFWSGNLGDLHADDVGQVQVRTRSRHSYELCIYPKDKDRVFVLLTGTMPRFTVRGWYWASEAKRQDWWADPTRTNRWSFFVPTSFLHPMAESPVIELANGEKVALAEPTQKVLHTA